MKKIILLSIITSILFSCNSNLIAKDFDCQTSSYSNLEKVTDYKKNFDISIPKNWKTKLYYDDAVSSIYSADTTVSLTNSTLIDASYVLNTTPINDEFINKVKADNAKLKLEEVKSKKTTFINNEAYYNLAKGKKGKFKYHVLNVFSNANTGFMHIKTEVYGDSLVNERICKAIKLIHNIQLK